MPSYKYVAVNELGKEVTGVMEATNLDRASSTLESQNLMPLHIEDNASPKNKSTTTTIESGSSGKRKKITDRDVEIRKSVKGAMRYPVIVVSMMIVAFLVLTAFVVPKFAGIFEQIGIDLPLPTKILIGLAAFLKGFWWLLILVFSGLFIGLKLYINTEQGAYWWDGFVLKLHIFGKLVLKTAVTRFTKMFETLSRSGLPILQIFEVVSRTIGNLVIGDALLKASEGIERGRGVSVSLAETGLFPPLVVRMISVGE